MTTVLTAVGHRWDSHVATLLESSTRVRIARRCADLPDLMATAAAGLGTVALVSAELRGLDLSSVARLHAAGLHVVGLGPPDDEGAERRLRQLGVGSVVPVGSALAVLEAALLEQPAGLQQHDGRPGADPPLDPVLLTAALDGGPPTAPWRTGEGAVPTDEGGDQAETRPPGRVIAVWGPAGAPGRTTVAVTLATELAGLGVPSVLVDADTYGGSVAQVLSLLDEAPGLVAAVRAAEHGALDLPTLARLSPEVTANLRVLTGIPKAERWPEIRPAPLERVLALARRLGEVVVDCGFSLESDEELSYDTEAPRRNAATLAAVSVADELLAVGSCDPVGLQRLVRGLQELGTVPSPPPRVVVNRVRASAVGPRPERRVAAALERFAGIHQVTFVPYDQDGLDRAVLQGRTLAECAPASPVRAAVRSLAAEIAGATVAESRRFRRRRQR